MVANWFLAKRRARRSWDLRGSAVMCCTCDGHPNPRVINQYKPGDLFYV